MRLLGQLFFEVRGSNSIVLILFFNRIFSDQKHSTRKCIKFARVEYLVAIVNSRGEKKVCRCCDTESRNSTHIGHIEVEFREITLNRARLAAGGLPV